MFNVGDNIYFRSNVVEFTGIIYHVGRNRYYLIVGKTIYSCVEVELKNPYLVGMSDQTIPYRDV